MCTRWLDLDCCPHSCLFRAALPVSLRIPGWENWRLTWKFSISCVLVAQTRYQHLMCRLYRKNTNIFTALRLKFSTCEGKEISVVIPAQGSCWCRWFLHSKGFQHKNIKGWFVLPSPCNSPGCGSVQTHQLLQLEDTVMFFFLATS